MVRGFRWFGAVAGLGLFACVDLGTTEDQASLEAPIIGGQPDTVSHGVVGILINQASLCTGSLLAPNLVLTARHCIANSGDESGVIICGVNEFGPPYAVGGLVVSWDNDLTDGVTPSFGVREIRVPPGAGVCGNDVAVLILDENIPASEATPLVPRLDTRPEAYESFDAVGYGIQNPNDMFGETAGVRMRANDNLVLCVGASECQGSGATNTEWAAESPICSGDSGGPALDAQGRVIGVTSRSNEDCSAALYGAVDSWKDMITEAALDAAELGDYDPPAWAGGVPPTGGSGGLGGLGGIGGSSASGGSGAIGTGGTAGSGSSTGGTGGSSGSSTGGSVSSGGTSGAGGSASSGSGGRGGSSSGGSGAIGTGGSSGGSSGSSNTGGSTNSLPGLGEDCTSTCAPGYACYADDDEPPGICVPPCSAAAQTCPAAYDCNTDLGVCTPEEDDSPRRKKDDAGCGCRTAPVSSNADHGWGAVLLAGVFAAFARRRRRLHSRG